MKKSLSQLRLVFSMKLRTKMMLAIIFSFSAFEAAVHAQPVLVKELSPDSRNFVTVDNILYYCAGDSLWRSDGTASGTSFVKKFGESIVFISPIRIGGDFLLLTHTSGQRSLWRSDGTASNTVKVGTYDLIVPLIAYNSNVYLRINDGIHGFELWKLTQSGDLSMVKDINPGTADGLIGDDMAISNGVIYFKGISPSGNHIWKTDGTSQGTQIAVELPALEEGYHSDNISSLVDVNGTIFFQRRYIGAELYNTIIELWKTEGTTASTSMVKRINEYGDYNSRLFGLTAMNGKLYFFHSFGYPQYDLMVSDGTEQGTEFIKTVGYDGDILDLTLFKNNLVFFDQSQSFPGAVQRSDGTAEGTQVVDDIADYLDNGGGYYDWINITGAGDFLYYADLPDGMDYGHWTDLELYRTDLTASNTHSLEDIYGISFAGTNNVLAAGNSVFFTTRRDEYFRLWFYDPNAIPLCSGTGIIHDLWTKVPGTSVSQIPVNKLYTSRDTLSLFEGPSNIDDKYGSRYRALLCAPQTGNYRFWIASNDNSELWLSNSTDRDDKVKIAYVNGATNLRQYNKYPSQQSALIYLEQGHQYYIEALHKEGVGTDHLSVGMQLPDGTLERPITGARLIPFTGNIAPEVYVYGGETNLVAPATITVHVQAQDYDGSLSKVELYLNGSKVSESTENHFTYTITNADVGTYVFTAYAIDNEKAVTTSDPKIYQVGGSGATGTILREVWTGIYGTQVSDIPVNSQPTSVHEISIFEGPSNIGQRYGTRIRGYVCPPATGNYIFFISSNDNSELWLSTDDQPENKIKIAYINGATGIREWTKYASQRSIAIPLQQNKRYYIEALHKQGVGTDNIAVGWQLPDGTYERPIPGNRLSPVDLTNASMARTSEQSETSSVGNETKEEISLSPNPASQQSVKLTLFENDVRQNAALQVEIVSMMGIPVYSKSFSCKDGCSEVMLDVQDKIKPGIYNVNIIVDQKRYAKRLVIK